LKRAHLRPHTKAVLRGQKNHLDIGCLLGDRQDIVASPSADD
jgi:hypothetical protein